MSVRPQPGFRRGTVAAIGGAEDKLRTRRILRRIVDLAGGADARIVVIPTASRNEGAGERYCRTFRDLGAADATIVHPTRRAECAESDILDAIEQATAIFLTGGNQLRLASVIGGTAAAKAIRQRNARGCVVAGTSAGAAILSEHMIAYGREGATPRAGMVSVVPGLGLVNQVIVDQHFRERDRIGRLLTALAYNPFAVGLGIDEDTAAFVGPDDTIEVVGSNAVTIVDAADTTHDTIGLVREGEPISLIGLRLHILVDGGTFDLRSRVARPAQETADDVSRARLVAADRDALGMHEPRDTPIEEPREQAFLQEEDA